MAALWKNLWQETKGNRTLKCIDRGAVGSCSLSPVWGVTLSSVSLRKPILESTGKAHAKPYCFVHANRLSRTSTLICGLEVLPRGDEDLYFHFIDGETKQRCKNKPKEHQPASMPPPRKDTKVL